MGGYDNPPHSWVVWSPVYPKQPIFFVHCSNDNDGISISINLTWENVTRKERHVSSQDRMNQYYPLSPHWMTDHEAIFPWKLHDVSDQKKPYHGKHTSFFKATGCLVLRGKEFMGNEQQTCFPGPSILCYRSRKPIFGGSLFDHQSYPPKNHGISRLVGTGDPRPLLYTSKTLYSRVQWFLGPVILRILGF